MIKFATAAGILDRESNFLQCRTKVPSRLTSLTRWRFAVTRPTKNGARLGRSGAAYYHINLTTRRIIKAYRVRTNESGCQRVGPRPRDGQHLLDSINGNRQRFAIMVVVREVYPRLNVAVGQAACPESTYVSARYTAAATFRFEARRAVHRRRHRGTAIAAIGIACVA